MCELYKADIMPVKVLKKRARGMELLETLYVPVPGRENYTGIKKAR